MIDNKVCEITTKKIAKNVIVSLSVQVVSILVGIILNLIVPKFIDKTQYAFWQVYVLYVSYVGVLHFGLLDGIVLNYSQYDYNQLDKQRIRSCFLGLLCLLSFLSIVSIFVALVFLSGTSRAVVILVGVGIISKNVYTYTSYTFQITNRINNYALIVILQKVVYSLFVVILLVLKVDNYIYFCVADLVGDAVSVLITSFLNKGLYFGNILGRGEFFPEILKNLSSGFMLMFANFSSSLIIGFAKMVVQWQGDNNIFGDLAFSFSLTSLFLTFVTAISVVLFPSLKRLDKDKLPSLYGKIRSCVSFLLFFIMIVYYPCCWILEKWLPKYSASFVYLGILLPIIIFSSKVNLLTNNYLKVYRKEKYMMIINVCSVSLAIILFLLSSYVLKSITLLLCCIVFVIMMNSIASEIVVSKVINVNNVKDYIIESIMVVLFVISSSLVGGWLGTAIYALCFVVYAVLNKNHISELVSEIKRK